MSAAQFLGLRDAFCELTGEAAPPLVPDAMGTLAFHQIVKTYAITFTYAPCLSSTDLFILMDFGQMPEAAGPAGWHTLMQCNTLMFGKHSPVFGLSEAGNLTMQRVYPLASANGQALRAVARVMADWADQWHAGTWLDAGDEPAAQAPLAAALMDRLA